MTKKNNKQWELYIIQTESGKLYTGITTDLERRFAEHKQVKETKKGAKFFRGQHPFRVVFKETYPDRSKATKREIEIKKMTRSQKLDLIGRRT